MGADTSVNLTPAGQILAMGLLLAMAPVVWVAWRNRGTGRHLQALAGVTLLLTLDLLLFGAFTRLTDSGLGCPDWPGCYGTGTPVGAQAQIQLAQLQMPTGPVTQVKAWIEMLHRYWATAVGGLVLLLAGLYAYQRKQLPPTAPSSAWGILTVLWIMLQGAFGALTVTSRLYPAIVTLHLLGAVVLLALLTRWFTGLAQAQQGRLGETIAAHQRVGIWLVLSLLVLQIALGGWVSSNYAVLACTEFPRCQGSFWPSMDFGSAFTLWRPLGQDGNGQYLDFAALTAIHVVHRLGALIVILATLILARVLWPSQALRRQVAWLLVLLLAQLATGLSNSILGWPLAAAVLHTGGAAALSMVMVWLLSVTRVATGQKAGA